MKEKIELVIRKFILDKYPEILGVDEIKHLSEFYKFLENYYYVYFKLNKEIKYQRAKKIDDDVKSLYQLIKPTNNCLISCLFDYGEGPKTVYEIPKSTKERFTREEENEILVHIHVRLMTQHITLQNEIVEL